MDKEIWIQVKQYFSEILELPADAQADFITQIEADQPEIAVMLKSLLKEDSDTYQALENPAVSKIKESQNATDLLGTQIGKYKLTFLIGIGGMGRVYLADRTDLEAHQQVAVKIISTGFLSEIYQKRFDRERKILSRLNHPHITRIYDGGISDAGMPYIIMEYVEGKPLLEYLSDHQLSFSKRLELFLDLCSAVAYAHSNLVMHRDLKPGNILVTNHGIIKVIDFGIAKILEDDDADDDLTLMGYIPLTPAYASPEHLKGQPLTVSSDIYSLGVILYELVSGNKPFPNSNRSNIALTERLNQKETMLKPSTNINPIISADLKSWQKNLKGDIDNIILKALKESPGERYISVDQFAEDIRKYQHNYPVLARPDSIKYRFRKYAKRNRSLVVLGCLLIVILIGGISATSWQAKIAAAQRDQTRHEAAKANEITRFLTNLFDHSTGQVITSENMLALGSEKLQDLSHQPALQGEMYRVIGDLYQKQNLFNEAEVHLLKALEIFDGIYGPLHEEVAKTKLLLGGLYAFMNKTTETIKMSQEAADLYAELTGTKSIEFVKATNYVGRGNNQLGEYQNGLKILQQASSIMESWVDPGEDQIVAMSSVYNDMATSYSGLEEHELYQQYLFKALNEIIKVKGEKNQNVAALYNNLAHSYYFLEKNDSAEYYSVKALAIANEVFNGKPNDRSQFAHCDLAKVYIKMGNFPEALKHATSCHEMAIDVYGENHFNTAKGLGVIGDVYIAMNDLTKANLYREASTHMYEVFFGGPHPMLAWQYWDEAYRYFNMGEIEKAIEYKRKCLDMYYKTMPDAALDIAEAKQILASYLSASKSGGEAIQLLQESLKTYTDLLGINDDKTQSVMRDLIKKYEGVKQFDDANEMRAMLYDQSAN